MRRTTLWIIVSFVVGMGTAFGLSYLYKEASNPRIESTEVFEVTLPDGTKERLSYSEIERDREEIKLLREKIRVMVNRRDLPKAPVVTPERPLQPKPSQASPAPVPSKVQTQASSKNLGQLFSKLMNTSTMKELASQQVNREAGELAAVLDLNKEETAKLEKILNKRKKLPGSLGAEAERSGEESDKQEPPRSLDEELRSLLTPEQFSRYQEYTEKKKTLSGATSLDKELFELKYRLNLTEDQEAPVKEVLKEQGEKSQFLPTSPGSDEEGTPLERIQNYMDHKSAIDKETAQRVQQILNEKQYADFVQYQEEKSAEVHIIKKLLEEEGKSESTPAP